MDDSHIEVVTNKDSRIVATVLAGYDAIEFYRVIQLRAYIKLWQKTGMMPTRGVTITKMLAKAGEIMNKPAYTRAKADEAVHDLTVWIETMQAALPILRDGVQT